MDKYEYAEQENDIPNIKAYLKNMKNYLEPRAKKWMESYETMDGDSLAIKGKPKVETDVDTSGKPFASLKCVLCRKNFRIGFEKQRGKNSMGCTFKRGNFDKHMKIYHKDFLLQKAL